MLKATPRTYPPAPHHLSHSDGRNGEFLPKRPKNDASSQSFQLFPTDRGKRFVGIMVRTYTEVTRLEWQTCSFLFVHNAMSASKGAHKYNWWHQEWKSKDLLIHETVVRFWLNMFFFPEASYGAIEKYLSFDSFSSPGFRTRAKPRTHH